MAKQPAIYILASQKNGTLYIGVTSNLQERIHQHKEGETGGFTSQYSVHRLVHVEFFANMLEAISREK
jgi:putative endonuclease